MRDWQVNPFYRGFRHLSFHFLVSWDLDLCPTPQRSDTPRATRAVSGPFFQAPVINGWVFSPLAYFSPDQKHIFFTGPEVHIFHRTRSAYFSPDQKCIFFAGPKAHIFHRTKSAYFSPDQKYRTGDFFLSIFYQQRREQEEELLLAQYTQGLIRRRQTT
jgi:hypothetical protein